MWCTAEDAQTITGTEVDAATLAAAVGTIEIYANRTQDVPDDAMSARDLAWLKRAVAWQAAWLTGQPGWQQRSLADRIVSDGQEVERSGEYAATLAPLAARAMRNLSWIGNRSDALLISRRRRVQELDATNEASDWSGDWTPGSIA